MATLQSAPDVVRQHRCNVSFLPCVHLLPCYPSPQWCARFPLSLLAMRRSQGHDDLPPSPSALVRRASACTRISGLRWSQPSISELASVLFGSPRLLFGPVLCPLSVVAVSHVLVLESSGRQVKLSTVRQRRAPKPCNTTRAALGTTSSVELSGFDKPAPCRACASNSSGATT
jgi:hypothetical protein